MVANNLSAPIQAVVPAGWCDSYANVALTIASIFLVVALIAAIVETGLALYIRLLGTKQGAQAQREAALVTDPAILERLLNALKGLLETLKGLPAWIAIFLAGLALLWLAGQRPDLCTAPAAQQPGVGAGSAGRPRGSPTAPFNTQATPAT